jgi:hypothetical protein
VEQRKTVVKTRLNLGFAGDREVNVPESCFPSRQSRRHQECGDSESNRETKALLTQAITSWKQDTLQSLLIPAGAQGFSTLCGKYHAILCQTVVAQESDNPLDRKATYAEESADHHT